MPEAPYAAVLSRLAPASDGRAVLDPEGKNRAFAVLFETGPAVDRAPPRPRWLVPPHGPVPLDIAELRVAFDEPVQGALALAGSSPVGRAVAEPPAVLGLDLAGGLAPGPLEVDLRGVRDAAGNAPFALEPLLVSVCPSGGTPAVQGAAWVVPGELSLTIRASLGTMGRLLAEVSALPGELACGAAPAPPEVAITHGDVLPCLGFDPCASAAVSCPGEVKVGGLCPGTKVRVRLLGEDLAHRRSAVGPWLEAASLPARPVPVLSEVLVDADAPEAGGEYVKVANLGTGEADLTGYVLAKRTSSGAFTRCTVAQLAGGAVPPGGHALVVGGSYDGRYALAPGTPVFACGASALAGGLANDSGAGARAGGPAGAARVRRWRRGARGALCAGRAGAGPPGRPGRERELGVPRHEHARRVQPKHAGCRVPAAPVVTTPDPGGGTWGAISLSPAGERARVRGKVRYRAHRALSLRSPDPRASGAPRCVLTRSSRRSATGGRSPRRTCARSSTATSRRGPRLPDGRLLHGGLLPRAWTTAETAALDRGHAALGRGARPLRHRRASRSTSTRPAGVGDKVSLRLAPHGRRLRRRGAR